MRIIGADLARKLRSHACRWAGLPEVTVPSAAVSDDDTRQWSADMYGRDLATEPKPRGEETASIVGMRPRALRRRLGLVFLGALIAGAVLGTGVARADSLDDYIVTNAPVVCSLLDDYPSVSGVEGLVIALHDEGFTGEEAGEIIGRSVVGWCPRHMTEVQAFIAKWAGAKQVIA